MNQRIGDQLAQGDFWIEADLRAKRLLDDFGVRQRAFQIGNQPFKPDRIAALTWQFIDRVDLVGAAITDDTDTLALNRRKLHQLACGSDRAEVGHVVAATIGHGQPLGVEPTRKLVVFPGKWPLKQPGDGVQVQHGPHLLQRQQGRRA